MRLAAIADIHGNAYALMDVLADIDSVGVDFVVNLGDFFSGPVAAGKTAEILMQRDFVSVRGNHDRYLIEQDRVDMGPSDRVAFDELSRAHLEWIAGLPPTRTLQDDIFLCHGSPKSDTTYWLERVDDDGTVRQASLAETAREAEGVGASLILCAHTHIPRCVRLPDGRTMVNPGSVGCPAYDDDAPVYHHMQTGTPNASYALVERQDTEWSVTFRSVPYDHNRASTCAAKNGRDDWARSLATGWFESGDPKGD